MDPAFAKTTKVEAINNIGGIFGAYTSSSLFELFGRSAYLLCIIFFLLGQHLIFKLPFKNSDYELSIAWIIVGALMFMISASSLEYLRFHHNDNLPAGAGGLVGKIVSSVTIDFLGIFGASLFYISVLIFSISLTAGMSWFLFFEAIGARTESLFLWLKNIISDKQYKRKQAKHLVKSIIKNKAVVSQSKLREITKKPSLISQQAKKSSQVKTPSPSKSVSTSNDLNTPIPIPQPTEESPPTINNDSKPTLELLDTPNTSIQFSEQELHETAILIEKTLASFNVAVKIMAVLPGPVVTRYDLQPATGVKGSQIVNLARDLARTLSVSAIRVLETIHGTKHIGLELPNKNQSMITLSEILSSDNFQSSNVDLPIALGKTASGEVAIVDLRSMPHLLVAGSTGSGKSVFINSTILSLLYAKSPDDIRFLLIDPKMLELSTYANIPHLLAPVITDMTLAPTALNWAVEEMERRYRKIAAAGVRSIISYNQAIKDNNIEINESDPIDHQHLPYIVIIIDELADLMMVSGKAIEMSISRLAQKARAAGIHMILATQRPSVDVITGLIKANVPSRLSFQVASKIDSRTILDQMGAESLLGKGDMLFLPPGQGNPLRAHGAFVKDQEVHRVVDYIHKNSPAVDYLTEFNEVNNSFALTSTNEAKGERDPLYDQAIAYVLEAKRPSISFVQRKLSVGYNRAARIIESMEEASLITSPNQQGIRKIIVRTTD